MTPIVAVVVAALRRALRLDPPPPGTEQGSPPQMPMPPQVSRPPRTADEQLDFARELVAEIKADRDKLAASLELANQRLAQQDALIARLQAALDAWSRQGPRPPPPAW